MVVILLEALAALLALVFIVWWTMFSGRPKGEPPQRALPPSAAERADPETAQEPAQQTATGAPSARPPSDET